MGNWNTEIPKAEWFDKDSPGLGALIREVADQKRIAIDTETTGLNVWKDVPLFWSASWGERRVCLPADTLPLFKEAFANKNTHWYFANAKYDMHILANYGIHILGKLVDIQVMHSLLCDDEPHGLKYIAKEVLGWKWSDFKDTFKLGPGRTYQDELMAAFHTDRTRLVEYAANDAYGTMQAGNVLNERLESTVTFGGYPYMYNTLGDIFWKTEMPFTRVLYKMERRGVLLDLNYLQSVSDPIDKESMDIEKEWFRRHGSLSISSSDDLIKVLIHGEGLVPLRWTKGGVKGIKKPSMDEEFLAYVAHKSPSAKMALDYRKLKKMKTNFIEGMSKFADPHDRVHARFNQDTARTGRLTCSAPPLQTIPNPEADEFKIRKGFVARKGFKLICRDFEALEMRVLAAQSGEPDMLKVFANGWDIHMGNASMVFNIPYEDIAKAKKKPKEQLTEYDRECLEYRRRIKVIGFGLNYGMKEKLLASNLGSSVEHAKEIMDKYLARYPAVKRFYARAIETTRASGGYAFSLLGRRRHLPNIDSHLDFERFRAERQASNMEVQGSAADIVRLAMLAIDDTDVEGRYGAEMVLQVHDELLFECPEETAVAANEEIKLWMSNSLPSDPEVAFTTSGSITDNWADAK